MSSKFKVQRGQVQVEFEGSEDFLEKHLEALLHYATVQGSSTEKPEGILSPISADLSSEVPVSISLTTNSIAAKLGVKSGPELIMAACASLALVKSNATFSRKQILDEMKSANDYYKDTIGSNLSAYLKTLKISKNLNETAKDTYAFPAVVKQDLEKRLVDH